MNRILILLCLGIVSIGSVSAQYESDFLSYYEEEFYSVHFASFGGLKLVYQGESAGIAFRRIPESLQEPLRLYPETEELLNTYSKKQTSGSVIYWGGVGLMTAGYIYTLATNNGSGNPEMNLGIGLGMVGIGTVIGLVGGFRMTNGQANLVEAVNLYNRYRARDYN